MDCTNEKDCNPGDTVNEDVIINDVLEDIQTGEYSRPEGVPDCCPEAAGQPEKVGQAERTHVEASLVEEKESSMKGDADDRNSDVPQGLAAGELHIMDNLPAAEALIFDMTPNCARKDGLNYQENTTDNEISKDEVQEDATDILVDDLAFKVYRRRNLSTKCYTKSMKNNIDEEEATCSFMSEGGSNF